jgi:peptide/nickel transport system permease protein
VAIPIGIISATRQYSLLDYVFTVLNYIGLATPNFLLALVLMWIAFDRFGMTVTGLFSPEYVQAPWSWGRFVNLLQHLWLPMIVLGVAGTAQIARVSCAPTCSTSSASPTPRWPAPRACRSGSSC